ncbi:MAG: ribosome assembly RNA-binding protein YhbY [Granulosicoccus sp.]
MPTPSLNKSQLKFLRSLAHALKPVVRLGQHGFTQAVADELESALDHHELVKIKLAADSRDARNDQLEAISKAAHAVVIQQIGHTATLYRQHAKKPVIDLKAYR